MKPSKKIKNHEEKEKNDIQAVVTIESGIFIEVISNVKASIVVTSVLEINEVEFIYTFVRKAMR